MRSRWILGVVVLLALVAAGCASQGADLGRSAARRAGCGPGDVSSAVVRVQAGNFTGTAFHIGGGEFITAGHVVATVPEVDLVDASQRTYHARVVAFDSTSDLAVLQMDEGEPPAGAMAWGLGAAPGDPLSAYIAEVGLLRRVDLELVEPLTLAGMRWLSLRELQAPLIAGDSGSPVVDRCGRVVGLVQAGDPAGGTALALSATSARLAVEAALRAPGGQPPPGVYRLEAQRTFAFSDCGETLEAGARWSLDMQIDEAGWIATSYSPTGGHGFVGWVDGEGVLTGFGADYREAWTGFFHENGSADLRLAYEDTEGCAWLELLVIFAPAE